MSKRTYVAVTLGLAAIATFSTASRGRADVVIGNWENATDGWIDWGTQAAIAAPKYGYSTIGATNGSTSLMVTQSGYNQNLALKLQNNSLTSAFFANTQFSIDYSTPTNGTAGYQQIYDMAINAQGYGFVSQNVPPKFTYGYPNGGPQTTTVTWNYANLVDGDPSNGEISPTATYVEFIIATNGDANHNVFYFDNAKLSLVGDFNHSGKLDSSDIEALLHADNGEVPFANAMYDVNNDGNVVTAPGAAASDTDYFVKTLAHTKYGDTNFDQHVNFDDLVVLAQNYNKQTGGTWATGSFNGDGIVNFDDLVVLAQNYNFGAGTGAVTIPGASAAFAADWALARALVPEPTSIAGLAGALCLARRRIGSTCR